MEYQMPKKGIPSQVPLSDGTLITGKVENFEVVGDKLLISLRIGGLTEEDRNYSVETMKSFLEGSVGQVLDLSVRRWRNPWPDYRLFHDDEKK